jgi:hypothetical protein
MGLLYGRAGRLTAGNGGFRRGQRPEQDASLQRAAAVALVAQGCREGTRHRGGPDFGSSLTASDRDSQSNCWVNWKIMGQPCEFQVEGGSSPGSGRPYSKRQCSTPGKRAAACSPLSTARRANAPGGGLCLGFSAAEVESPYQDGLGLEVRKAPRCL